MTLSPFDIQTRNAASIEEVAASWPCHQCRHRADDPENHDDINKTCDHPTGPACWWLEDGSELMCRKREAV